MTSAPESYRPADRCIDLTDHTVGSLLELRAAQAPDRTALVGTGHDGAPRRYTYRELHDEARRIASGLAELTEPGEFVALWAPNLVEWPLIEYGAALAGVVLVALNPVLRPEELRYALDHSGAVVLLHADRSRDYDLAEVAQQVAGQCPRLRAVISLGSPERYTSDATTDLPPVDQLSPVMLQYTSGTTGTPKGVLLHHRALVNDAKLTMEAAEIEEGSVCLNPLPMFHTAACVISTLGPLSIGGCMVLMERFDPAAALAAMRDEQVRVLMSVPTVLGAIVEAAVADGGQPPPLRTVLVGASNVPSSMIETVEQRFGASVHNLFGQTELSPVLTLTRRSDDRRDQVRSVGRPLPHVECKIVDPATGETTPLGVPGEICARGFQQLIEYYRNPEATAKAVDPDGWLHLGDLGSMDERGMITLTGRLKDLIIRGGENIAPAEIESCLVTHRSVLDASVIGLPDERWGEIVVAVVRLRDRPTDVEAELIEHCRAHLAKFKVPARVVVVEEFPMTPTGKVQKFRLRDQLLAD
ncbi:class I adenylate-forming enzyme family protein [Pseudonocardia spinosispora]|uniref:class I adenylate-forming enzyme family protein n=1 Tax=Pseudonocardia spinosispora TaxID=103441 RepID=UPI000426CEB3|nr:AMP-binding protein [Pseudonocardia spinosispora]